MSAEECIFQDTEHSVALAEINLLEQVLSFYFYPVNGQRHGKLIGFHYSRVLGHGGNTTKKMRQICRKHFALASIDFSDLKVNVNK